MKSLLKCLMVTVLVVFLNSLIFPEVVEKIYAVVNDELITYTELKNFEQGMIASLRDQFKGEELEQKIDASKKELLNMLIDRKLLLSRAKEKKYDVEQYLEIVIKEIMKKNNFNTKEDLRNALTTSGIDYEEWRKYQKNELISQSLIQNELGSRITVENSEIMEYYRKNADKYTKPAEFSLNCIFLDKKNYLSEQALEDKKKEIAAKLAANKNFEETAKEYSEMTGAENNFFLGDYKKGELNAAIEEAAMKLKAGEISDWIDTENGWYMIQMIKFTAPQLIEYKTIRDEIEQTIKEDKLGEEIKKYIKQLRDESHIKIYEEYR